MEENNRLGNNELGPPVKVISKWKTPFKIINRIVVCHFAANMGGLHVGDPLPVISLVFDWSLLASSPIFDTLMGIGCH